MLGAQTHPPVEAVAFGLVDEVVPEDELLDRALAVARRLATDIPPDTFAVTKAQLRREHVGRMDAYTDERDPVAEVWSRRVTDGWTAGYLAEATGRT